MPLHLLVKWGRWFLQIVDIHVGNFNMMLTGRWFPQIVDYKGQWESMSNIYITKIVVLVSEPVRGRTHFYIWSVSVANISPAMGTNSNPRNTESQERDRIMSGKRWYHVRKEVIPCQERGDTMSGKRWYHVRKEVISCQERGDIMSGKRSYHVRKEVISCQERGDIMSGKRSYHVSAETLHWLPVRFRPI